MWEGQLRASFWLSDSFKVDTVETPVCSRELGPSGRIATVHAEHSTSWSSSIGVLKSCEDVSWDNLEVA